MGMKIGIVIPYFGKFPSFFRWWYESAAANSEIDFHLVTDQELGLKPCANIFLHQMSFDVLCKKLDELLGAKYFKNPYKLCDFKPAYGYLFNDIVSDYDYWGYADLDLVFGDVTKFIKKTGVFGVYDKILDLGHLSFYRNLMEINMMFRRVDNNRNIWPYIRDSEIIWVCDENYNKNMNGVNGKLLDNKFRLYSERDCFSDVHPGYLGFYDMNNASFSNCFFWSFAGRLHRASFVNNNFVETEIVYAHFQKREVSVVDCPDGLRIFLPHHWPECSSYNEAVDCLVSLRDVDREKNSKFSQWKKKRKINKYMLLFREFFTVKGAVNCFIRIIYGA